MVPDGETGRSRIATDHAPAAAGNAGGCAPAAAGDAGDRASAADTGSAGREAAASADPAGRAPAAHAGATGHAGHAAAAAGDAGGRASAADTGSAGREAAASADPAGRAPAAHAGATGHAGHAAGTPPAAGRAPASADAAAAGRGAAASAGSTGHAPAAAGAVAGPASVGAAAAGRAAAAPSGTDRAAGPGCASGLGLDPVPDLALDLVRDFAGALGRPCAAGTATAPLAELSDALNRARRISRAAPLRWAPARVRPLTTADAFVELAVADVPFVDSWLATVARHLEPGPDLVVTLDTYYRHDMDRGAAAAALNVHPRTLDYRLRRVRELTGLTPGSTRGVRVLSAAVARRLAVR
ncbi:hypothetical protein FH965_32525 [Streptomyces spectabilis]|uniref:PucR C-terminal helix-turn-helix domain-containing protein n=1 Tax=Streptomyces spectabilis TaxID=68270 RepID=A0A516RLZ7_STRST|nr:hypothetical protein FH965_32525 [Streptomyces spectabilis]